MMWGGRGWYPDGGDGWSMHGGGGWGGLLAMSLFLVLLVALVVAALAVIVRSGSTQPLGTPPERRAHGVRSAIRTLEERYARGEVDDEEYVRRRDLLRAGRH